MAKKGGHHWGDGKFSKLQNWSFKGNAKSGVTFFCIFNIIFSITLLEGYPFCRFIATIRNLIFYLFFARSNQKAMQLYCSSANTKLLAHILPQICADSSAPVLWLPIAQPPPFHHFISFSQPIKKFNMFPLNRFFSFLVLSFHALFFV